MGPGMSASCEKNGAVPFGYKEGVMRGIRGIRGEGGGGTFESTMSPSHRAQST